MPATPETCPICAKLQDARFKPFCSKRCTEIDLGRWLSGKYAIPGNEPVPDSDADPEKPE